MKTAAQEIMNKTDEFYFLDDRALSLTIYCFPIAPMIGDIDNIIKPIADALNCVAYLDDRVIERVVVQKFEPSIDWTFTILSEQLTAALEAANDPSNPSSVVYVRLDDDLSWRTVS